MIEIMRKIIADLSAKSSKKGKSKISDKPLLRKEILKLVKPRKPLKNFSNVLIDLNTILTNTVPPQLQINLKKSSLTKLNELSKRKLAIDISYFGKHVFPPKIKTKKHKVTHSTIEKISHQPQKLTGFLPSHLSLRAFPSPIPRNLRVPYREQSLKKKLPKDVHYATTIFPPDNRYVFNDTSFPWSTTGLVETPIGKSSGVMIGPRHMLTVSHGIQWNSDGTAGSVKFTPSYFDGSTPFGAAGGTWVYYERKVRGPTIDWGEGQHDYVVVVLNTRMGNITGWIGSRTYSDSWDGGRYWSHIGYPGDIASGRRPTFQGSIALDGEFWDPQIHQRIWHKGDVWPGQSGGPYFGWWNGESWPRAVGVQSGQTPDENSASGGSHMVDLIIRARNDFP